MADGSNTPAQGTSAWGQAVTAVALVGALGFGLWVFQQTSSSSEAARPPATCSGGEPEKASDKPGKTARETDRTLPHVAGAQLCEALNRPGLAELLGTPGEIPEIASGSDDSFRPAPGEQIPNPSARVEFETYTVTLSATYDRLTVAEYAELLKDSAQPQTVLGRKAVVYSDRTISVRFRLGGGDDDSESRPGVPTRTVIVAKDARDSGGSFEVTLWRADGQVPDDVTLIRTAEAVLPTVPGWAAEG